MELLLVSALRALRSTFAPGMFGIFIQSILITLLALIVFVMVISGVFVWVGSLLEAYPWAAGIPWLAGIGATMLAWFLFPGIMPIIVNFFDARIARLIEQHEYPQHPATANPPFWEELRHDACFSLQALLLNILVLPLYLMIPILHLLPFYLLNGYLLGREFFVMAARRHMPITQAEALRREHGRCVLIAGIALAVLATIPLINLLAPFWGVAIMVHLFHQLLPMPDKQIEIH